MTPLAHVILALLVVSQTPALTVYAPQVSRHPLGTYGRVEQLAGYYEKAAKAYHVGVEYLVAKDRYESAWMPRARSKAGALGFSQLMPQFKWGRSWLADCRVMREQCEELNVVYGAAALRDGLQRCGSYVRAMGWYRTGRCVAGPRARLTVELAWQVAWRLKHPSTRKIVVRRLR